MIISHQHQFCFFAIPRTASTAVSRLLMDKYGGEEILRKHSSYKEFMKQASKAEKQYFKFTAIRNPMDSVVSAYFKKKSNHNGRFSRGTFSDGRPISKQQLEEYHFIISKEASFAEYFSEFYHKPYRRPRHEETVRHMDVLIKFEDLDKGFEKVTNLLKLPYHPIPLVNTTSQRDENFLQFYTPEIIPLARRVFAPIMKDWGYDFPVEW